MLLGHLLGHLLARPHPLRRHRPPRHQPVLPLQIQARAYSLPAAAPVVSNLTHARRCLPGCSSSSLTSTCSTCAAPSLPSCEFCFSHATLSTQVRLDCAFFLLRNTTSTGFPASSSEQSRDLAPLGSWTLLAQTQTLTNQVSGVARLLLLRTMLPLICLRVRSSTCVWAFTLPSHHHPPPRPSAHSAFSSPPLCRPLFLSNTIPYPAPPHRAPLSPSPQQLVLTRPLIYAAALQPRKV
jgi:hypothetical protein